MTDSSVSRPLLHASDLIGCRYRLSLDLREGRLVEPASHQEHRLPTSIASIPGLYTVVSGPDAHLDTLEAIARGESVIAGAVLMHERPIPGGVYSGIDEICHPDLLVKVDDSPQTTSPTYMPVLVVTRHLLSLRANQAGGASRRQAMRRVRRRCRCDCWALIGSGVMA